MRSSSSNSSINTWQKGVEVEWSRQLAHLRIHIERVIGLMRNKYKIPKGVLPITLIKRPSDTTAATVNKIVTVQLHGQMCLLLLY